MATWLTICRWPGWNKTWFAAGNCRVRKISRWTRNSCGLSVGTRSSKLRRLQASNCAVKLHNTGTTNINPALLARLSQKTTYAPAVLTNNFTSDTTLSPIVPRDDDSLPDIGFHYDPIDWAWSGLTVS